MLENIALGHNSAAGYQIFAKFCTKMQIWEYWESNVEIFKFSNLENCYIAMCDSCGRICMA